jgi:hypothetical protein
MPARRGMRAAWFRGRAPGEVQPPVERGVQPPDAGTLDPTPDPVMPCMRPAFGHPTA